MGSVVGVGLDVEVGVCSQMKRNSTESPYRKSQNGGGTNEYMTEH